MLNNCCLPPPGQGLNKSCAWAGFNVGHGGSQVWSFGAHHVHGYNYSISYVVVGDWVCFSFDFLLVKGRTFNIYQESKSRKLSHIAVMI